LPLCEAAPSYTQACDIWSVGVVCFVVLCGFPPFNAGNERLTYNLVAEGELTFPSPAWDSISPEAIAFIGRLMNRNPEERPTAFEAMKDPWLIQENVQPKGLDRRASFVPASSSKLSLDSQQKLLRHSDREKQNAFRRFLNTVKVRFIQSCRNSFS
jgi:calcium-dependent protein kinase